MTPAPSYLASGAVSRFSLRFWLALTCLWAGVVNCPAPLIYRPGEGWTYEAVGAGASWQRKRAKDQLAVAQEAFDAGQYRLALKAAKHTTKTWPLSDASGRAQYLVGRCYEARKMDERAFKEYQKALTKYPKLENYAEIQQRQFAIANRYLGGQWFKLWGYIPFFPSMDRTAKLFDQVNKNGPYSEIGPKALMNIGAAREKQKDYRLAVRAYERAADKYYDRPKVGADAMYAAGIAWNRLAKRAEYDQSIAGNAINFLNDFKALYPDDQRNEEANKIVSTLKTEQARGALKTAEFYEKYKRYQGALVYYNEVLVKDPNSVFAAQARERIDALKPKAQRQVRRWSENDARMLERERVNATNAPTAKGGKKDK
ncbi:MAG: hypothetical protein RIT19_580 [Verrucomicrobiota bacterium]